MVKIKKMVLVILFAVMPLKVVAQTEFDFVGDVQTYVVPASITAVKIEVWGAQGGGSEALGAENQDDGGLGGYAAGVLVVTPGQTLNVYVGGKPGLIEGTGISGGYNGGGASGQYGGAGGGASDVRLGGTSFSDRVIVAGGGGGGNTGAPDQGSGGDGGGLLGIDGVALGGFTPGTGGTQSSGGIGSGPSGFGTGTANDGELGIGGSGVVDPYHMAGGGGGYYGGGAAEAAGGGGGSSYVGGLIGATTTPGVKSGDGAVIITPLEAFNFSGAMQTYTVPADIYIVKLEAWGAQGGISEACDVSMNEDDGGLGGYATGLLSVTPGQILNVYVGEKPGQVNGVGSPGGYNGGGASGQYGGAGGGASDVRTTGDTLTDRVIVAGGGGGGNSGCPDHGAGGSGGGLSGLIGETFQGNDAGTGGTQVAGGVGSGPSTFSGFAEDGALGIGGSGTGEPYHIAGGGGGYYGGGAAFAAGAGGGSSYIDGLLEASTSDAAQTGHGLIVITPVDLIFKDGFE